MTNIGKRLIFPDKPGITRLIPLPGVNLAEPATDHGQLELSLDLRCGNCEGVPCEDGYDQGDFDQCSHKEVKE